MSSNNDRHSPPLPSPAATDRRRASVSALAFQDLFARSNSHATSASAQSYSGPITTAAVNAHRRRLSLSTVGLGGSIHPPALYQSPRPRTESLSSANSGSVDESPFEDDANAPSSGNSVPASPFARRLSFGARALRDVRQSGAGIGNPNGSEGYNFAENLRSRAERTSMSGNHPAHQAPPAAHQRAKSVAIMEPPVREMPKQPQVPDAMQERILKGDFYMD